MNYIVTGTTYNSKFTANPGAGIRVLSGEELQKSDIRFSEQDMVYVPSETSLSTVMERMDNPTCVHGIEQLKDKYLCREALRHIYPDFFCAKFKLDEISSLSIPGRKLVVKPLKGFFGTGVRVLDPSANLLELGTEITREIAQYSRFFPESILTKNEFLMEEYVEGEEYAVDMYYDSSGSAVIMNIYHHPVARIPEYAHLMYYSSKELFDKYLEPITELFQSFGAILGLRNFPIHAEFKLRGTEFIPIEFNPMRYGGFGLADLTFLSYGFQPIAAFFDNLRPDFAQIWESRASYSYAFILAYNGRGIDLKHKEPRHDDFRSYLLQHVELLDYVKLDHHHNPVFAIAYVRSEDSNKLGLLLDTEFADFFG